jgi:hypothetical protein
MKTQLLKLWFVFSAFACVYDAAFAHELADNSRLGIAVESGHIFTAEISAKSKLCLTLSDCWTPTEQVVGDIPALLFSYLSSAESYDSKAVAKRFKDYKLKYFGFKRDGRPIILINGLCNRFWHPEAKKFSHPARPFTDMGRCFFSVEFDYTQRSFSDFYVDGES